MQRLIIALCFACLAALLLIGCGGGGGTTTETGTGSGGGTITLYTTDEEGAALTSAEWVAVQDGSGPWTRVTPDPVGRYQYEVTDGNGRYGLAIVSAPIAGMAYVRVIQATVAEMDTLVYPLPFHALAGGVAIGGDFTGHDTLQGRVYFGKGRATVDTLENTYSLTVPSGVRDLAAGLFDPATNAIPARLFLQRVKDAGTLADYPIDLASAADAFDLTDLATATVTSGAGLSPYQVTATLVTAGGTDVPLGQWMQAPYRFPLLPASRRAANDRYLIMVEGDQPNGNLYVTYRMSGTAGDVAVAGPTAVFDNPAISTSGGLTATWVAYPAAKAYTFWYQQNNAQQALQWEATVSAGWLSGRGTVYALPDLGTAPGFETPWRFDTGYATYPVNVEADVLLGNRPLRDLYDLSRLYNAGDGRMPGHLAADGAATVMIAYPDGPGAAGMTRQTRRDARRP